MRSLLRIQACITIRFAYSTFFLPFPLHFHRSSAKYSRPNSPLSSPLQIPILNDGTENFSASTKAVRHTSRLGYRQGSTSTLLRGRIMTSNYSHCSNKRTVSWKTRWRDSSSRENGRVTSTGIYWPPAIGGRKLPRSRQNPRIAKHMNSVCMVQERLLNRDHSPLCVRALLCKHGISFPPCPIWPFQH